MTREVLIDGVKYVPQTEDSVQIMEQVLKSQMFLSDDAIGKIIDEFKNFKGEIKTPEKPKKGRAKSSDSFKYNKEVARMFKIARVEPNGTVIFERGRYQRSTWTIQQAGDILNCMHRGKSTNMLRSDVHRICKEHNLTYSVVARIMYNLEYGDLCEWISKWKEMNTPKLTRKQVPVQNNPQKRREGGYV